MSRLTVYLNELDQFAKRRLGPSAQADAVHEAAAVTMGVPVLAPWNFRHLVNVARRAKVNAVNASRGLGSIEIVAPPEVQ